MVLFAGFQKNVSITSNSRTPICSGGGECRESSTCDTAIMQQRKQHLRYRNYAAAAANAAKVAPAIPQLCSSGIAAAAPIRSKAPAYCLLAADIICRNLKDLLCPL